MSLRRTVSSRTSPIFRAAGILTTPSTGYSSSSTLISISSPSSKSSFSTTVKGSETSSFSSPDSDTFACGGRDLVFAFICSLLRALAVGFACSSSAASARAIGSGIMKITLRMTADRIRPRLVVCSDLLKSSTYTFALS